MPTQWKCTPEDLHRIYVANTEAFYRTAARWRRKWTSSAPTARWGFSPAAPP